MSDFAVMAAQLVGSCHTGRAVATSKTDQIRRLLAAKGTLTARSIAAQLDIESSTLVSALLAHDLRNKRIERIGDQYRLVESWDEQLQAELADAAAFLRRNGYTVTKPDSPHQERSQ